MVPQISLCFDASSHCQYAALSLGFSLEGPHRATGSEEARATLTAQRSDVVHCRPQTYVFQIIECCFVNGHTNTTALTRVLMEFVRIPDDS